MDIKAQRLEILQQIENGEMTLEEASRWLAALDRVKSKNGSQPQVEAENLVETKRNSSRRNDAVASENANSAVIVTEPSFEEARPVEPDMVVKAQAQAIGNREEFRPPFWRGWWLIVFIPGLLLLTAAVNWMIQGYLAAGLRWGFWLSFIPFTIGVL